jgi:hypothetical protein
MTNEKLTELLKIAYRWGRDNGEGRSEKNFNDLLQTEAINQALRIHAVVSRRELLLDFAEYSENDKTSTSIDECVDNYLDSIKQ